MSQAFMREKEEQWLGDVEPTLSALIQYLVRENNGAKVSETQSHTDPETKKTVHDMSDGNSYTLDDDGRWKMV